MGFAFEESAAAGQAGRSAITSVVHDIDRTVEFYGKAFGVGPFEIREVDSKRATWHGDTVPTRFRIASAPLGPCEMELIEVVSGRPPHAEFLDREGEGMNHLNLDYRDAESYLGRMLTLHEQGVHHFWGFPHSGFCYVESEKIGGITFEVMRGSGHAGKKGHNHLGLVVADTDRTIEFYHNVIGLPGFRTNVFPMKNATYRDKLIDAAFKASFTDLGEGRIELIQPLDGGSPFADFLKNRGEGMHHLRLGVDDRDAAVGKLNAKGIEAFWSCPEAEMTLLDTQATGGMCFGLQGAGFS
ncbi:MAG: 4-hydroxyphenylpyruvate dioxygenase/hemolysin-like protein [Rhodospirillales bacterium]|nr:4-hydroxyphenylpyruvate dioxygenase/hemolysin-like protein [Rhodospirillales bacterium]